MQEPRRLPPFVVVPVSTAAIEDVLVHGRSISSKRSRLDRQVKRYGPIASRRVDAASLHGQRLISATSAVWSNLVISSQEIYKTGRK